MHKNLEMSKFFKSCFWLVVLAALATQCHKKAAWNQENQGQLKLLCTTSIMADAVRHIVSDSVSVVSLMGVGVDPHVYKPTQRDIFLLLEADLIVSHGLHLEGKLSNVLSNAGKKRLVIRHGDYLSKTALRQVGDGEAAYDPHIWFDVQLFKQGLIGIANALSKHHKNAIDSAKFTVYMTQLDQLDSSIKQLISTIPAEKRIMVTAHDAFAYFGKRYGLQVYGLQGVSTVGELDLKQLTTLRDKIVEQRIPAVFAEQSLSSAALQALAKGASAKGWNIKMAPGLYTDALGSAPHDTYINMVSYNTQTIVSALR